MSTLIPGVFDGPCNRSACRAPGARWWNIGSERYYCESCGLLINENTMAGVLLCSPHTADIRKDPDATFFSGPPTLALIDVPPRAMAAAYSGASNLTLEGVQALANVGTALVITPPPPPMPTALGRGMAIHQTFAQLYGQASKVAKPPSVHPRGNRAYRRKHGIT